MRSSAVLSALHLESQGMDTDPHEPARRSLLALLHRGIYGDSKDDAHVILCAVCLRNVVVLLAPYAENTQTEMPNKTLFRTQRAFWRDSMLFLTDRRDGQTLDRLDRAFEPRCNEHEGVNVEVDGHNTFHYVIMCLSSLLFAFALRTNPGQNPFRANDLWPACIDDVFPRGLDPSYRAMLDLWARYHSAQTSKLLVIPAGYARNEVNSLYARHRQTLVQTLSTRLFISVERFSNAANRMDAIGAFASDSDFLAMLLMDRNLWNNAEELHHLALISHLLTRVLPYCDARIVPRVSETLAMARARLPGGDFNSKMSRQWAQIVGVSDASGNTRLPADPFERFLAHWRLLQMARKRQCDREICERHGEVERLSLQSCSGCRVARYCSKECQRAAWKSGKYPHKTFCQAVQGVQRTVSFDLDFFEFSQACCAAGFTLDDVARLIHQFRQMEGSLYDRPYETLATCMFLSLFCLTDNSRTSSLERVPHHRRHNMIWYFITTRRLRAGLNALRIEMTHGIRQDTRASEIT